MPSALRRTSHPAQQRGSPAAPPAPSDQTTASLQHLCDWKTLLPRSLLFGCGIRTRGPVDQGGSSQAVPRNRCPTRGNGGDEGLEDNPGWYHGPTAQPFAAGPISELMSTEPKPKASQAT